jgi:PTH1 family peptidyl-tRNA hydrolase
MIVGLGNPGVQYASSRHNVGFMVADRFADAHHLTFARRRFNALLAEGTAEDRRVLVAKPLTFMNLSGRAVAKLHSFFRISLHDIIVVYDDLDLPFGRLRLRPGGSAGGHHGMESILSALGDEHFARLRFGIGRSANREDVGHVLGNFSDEEQRELQRILARAVAALDIWLREGIVKAMNEFNR